ncbi:hypothetical protein [Sporomusa acidovorans]|uniref:Uncharacterized protein n=1 Tax=Sporomusa acidovorans (strain ATCC 49682 / DSM 3132 / Mol) TaxID=1123286 RepID=A0ABZ3J3R2_SPOA4|nr:hypothetical protein [Sporomusa acidovorans]OZC20033.1 hypothetical protein SPACI_24310 [Sporomusa acidovorans DSM 3132]SDD47008.1 hypothetical protein SAMN04488499_1001359 [Sporomusa acidovorans]
MQMKVKNYMKYLIFIFAALLGSSLGSLSRYIETINNVIGIYGLASIIVILGFFAYVIRCRFRLSYGILETTFGLAFVGDTLSLWETRSFEFYDTFSMVVGLFIIACGLDNMGKGLA